MALTDLVTRSGITYSVKIYTDRLTISGASGAFSYGETVTGGTSSATGIVAYYDSTNTKVYLVSTSGTFQASETITGGTSGETATVTAVSAGDWMDSYVDIANLRDSVSLSRTRETTTVLTFDSSETDFADKITGIQDGSLSFTAALAPGNSSYQLLESGFEYNLTTKIKRVRTDRGSSNTSTKYYEGLVSNFSETDSVGDITTVSVQFEISNLAVS